MYISSEKRDDERNWKEYTLVVPAVSVGNVGQLAADLLISTLWMERIGHIFHDSILPLVGNDPFAHPDATQCKIVTSCDVYASLEHKLIVIQQRAPFIKGKRNKFKEWLVNWIKEKEFRQLIILTSTYAEERLDSQLQGDQFRFIASPQMLEQNGRKFEHEPLNWQRLETRQRFPASSADDSQSEQTDSMYMPGGGIAKTLYEECSKNMAVVILMSFCSEGDNIPDAVHLDNRLNQWLDLVNMQPRKQSDGSKTQVGWKMPSSWRHLYGSRADQTLFH